MLIQGVNLCSSVIVILRTWALYGRKLWPVILLGSVYLVALTVQTVSVVLLYRSIKICTYTLRRLST